MEIHFCFALTYSKLSQISVKTEYNLEEKMFCKWFQLYHAIPHQWKRIVKTTNDSCTNIVYPDHRFVKCNRIVALEKLHSKEIN